MRIVHATAQEGTRRVGTHTELLYHNPNPNLDLWPFSPKTISLVGYRTFISYTKFEHFGMIRFHTHTQLYSQIEWQIYKIYKDKYKQSA